MINLKTSPNTNISQMTNTSIKLFNAVPYGSKNILAKCNGKTLTISVYMTFLLKKIWWDRPNLFSVSSTVVTRMFTQGLRNAIEKNFSGSIVNMDQIVDSLIGSVLLRRNDTDIDTLTGDYSPLDVYERMEDFENKSKQKHSSSSKVDSLDGVAPGYGMTCRYVFEGTMYDVDEDLRAFPFDYTDLKMDLTLENKKIEVELDSGELVELKTDFVLLSSFNYSNNLSVKHYKKVDNMDSHDFSYNNLGYRLFFTGRNALGISVSIMRNPEFVMKYALFPMICIQLFSSVVTVYGSHKSKLNNLLWMFMNYGAYAIISASEIIKTKSYTLVDKIYRVSLIINVIQFVGVLFDFMESESVYQMFPAISVILFLYSMLIFFEEYFRFKYKNNIFYFHHADIVRFNDDLTDSELMRRLEYSTLSYYDRILLYISKVFYKGLEWDKFFKNYDRVYYKTPKMKATDVILNELYKTDVYTDAESNTIQELFEKGYNWVERRVNMDSQEYEPVNKKGAKEKEIEMLSMK